VEGAAGRGAGGRQGGEFLVRCLLSFVCASVALEGGTTHTRYAPAISLPHKHKTKGDRRL
jgi:hypothetical protein